MRNWWSPGDPMPDQPPALPDPSDLGPGIFPDATVYDAMDISGTNLMIDHVSTLYATDESISMNEACEQHHSPIQQHFPRAELPSVGCRRGRLHRARTRLAVGGRFGGRHQLPPQPLRTSRKRGCLRCRVAAPPITIFAIMSSTTGLEPQAAEAGDTYVNLVGNFYLAGNGGDQPVGGNNTGITTANGGTSVMSAAAFSVYRSGNLLDTNKDGDAERRDRRLRAVPPVPFGPVAWSLMPDTTDTAAGRFRSGARLHGSQLVDARRRDRYAGRADH